MILIFLEPGTIALAHLHWPQVFNNKVCAQRLRSLLVGQRGTFIRMIRSIVEKKVWKTRDNNRMRIGNNEWLV